MMSHPVRLAASAIVLFAAPVTAQSVSYTTNRPAPVTGDADKIVCQKEDKIGSRLGAKKVCLTVAEWKARAESDREQTEDIQTGARAPCTECPQESGKPF